MEVLEKLDDELTRQLAALYEKVWFSKGRKLEDIKQMLEQSYLTLAFVEGGRLNGFCRAISDGVYKAFLFDVIVDSPFQGQGLGKRIVETVINHEKLRHIQHIELYCPEEVSPFYHKLGFETRTSLLLRKGGS